jgi:hypothetical protein
MSRVGHRMSLRYQPHRRSPFDSKRSSADRGQAPVHRGEIGERLVEVERGHLPQGSRTR